MLTPEDWAILRTSAILHDLPEADLATLVNERSVRSIERGHVLFQQGDPARAFFLVLGGQVKLSRVNPGGDEAIVHIYGAGDSFAEAAMFVGGRYPVAAEAVVASRVMHIEGDALRRIVRAAGSSWTSASTDARAWKRFVRWRAKSETPLTV